MVVVSYYIRPGVDQQSSSDTLHLGTAIRTTDVGVLEILNHKDEVLKAYAPSRWIEAEVRR
jgi:hypothetical protein